MVRRPLAQESGFRYLALLNLVEIDICDPIQKTIIRGLSVQRQPQLHEPGLDAGHAWCRHE